MQQSHEAAIETPARAPTHAARRHVYPGRKRLPVLVIMGVSGSGKSGLLNPQLATLELPTPDENVLVVDSDGTAAETADFIIQRLGLTASGRPSATDPS
jgi:ABC-type lipoprotein export system ATPase subunit